MSEDSDAERIEDQARLRETEYDWLTAADLYQKTLGLVSEQDFLKKGEICERLGYAFHRAAMQAANQEEFRDKMQRAIEAYEKAQRFYEKLEDKRKAAIVFRCEALAEFLSYWLTSDPAEKRRLLDRCLELEEKALLAFQESGDMLGYGKMYGDLPLVFYSRVYLEWNRQTMKSIVERGLQWGEKALTVLSQLRDADAIARAYFVLVTCIYFQASLFEAEPEEMEKIRLKAVKYLNEAVDLSEKVGDAHVLGLLHFWWGNCAGGEEARGHFEKALEYGKQTRDNFLLAWGSDYLAYTTYWKTVAAEDPEERTVLVEKAMELYDEGQNHYSIISFMSPRSGLIGPPAGRAEHYFFAAKDEPDIEKRLEFLEKSEKAGIEALRLAENSDMPQVIGNAMHVLSKTLEARAHMESDPSEKRSRLEKALEYREKTIEIFEQLTPFDYWNIGVMYNYLAGIKTEIAEIESDPVRKKRLLEEAVLSKEKCLQQCNKKVPYFERMGDLVVTAALQGYQDTYSVLLIRLYNITNELEHLRKAIEISQKAIESASKLDMVSHIAESYWKIAKAQDLLREHLKAAENFEHASENYKKAAEKISQLKEFYQDYSSYMEAWNQIERARHHHQRQEYGLAKEHFEKAANIHKSLKKWCFLAPNYSAWTQIESAEDLSRKERSEEAKNAFEQAVPLFRETKKSLETELNKIENADEKQMVTGMVKATDIRREYCIGRVALEEAKILDKKGDHYSSSEKYGLAAEIFEKITQSSESDQDQRELRLILTLSRAWQKMTEAEAEASPSLYMEASHLFEQAKELSPNEKTKMLALGHSRFCRALEEGTKFADTRDLASHSAAVQHLESASNYYVKAGFQNASEYAKATGLLFDAYMHMDNAKKENDPRTKAKLYIMAEKILQSSAGSFMKAEHPEKREQVLTLLEKVKEERELALSLSEVLHAPSIVSSTAAFVIPTPTQENAVGLERFEHADIQANILARQKSMKVGENLDLEIELVNTGKGSATLIKLAEVIPEGFELTEKPETYRVEDSYINMKGKRLDPLKTEEVRLVLKPKTKGTFPLKPKILYLDENGKYKAYEPEPTTIEVQELGISGWIKGPRKTG